MKDIIIKDSSNYREVLRVEIPCDIYEFKDSFLDDDAVFGFPDILKHRGDMINDVSHWYFFDEEKKYVRKLESQSWIRNSPIGSKYKALYKQIYGFSEDKTVKY